MPMEEEIFGKLSDLTEEEKQELCDGNFAIADSCLITMKIFSKLFEIAENCSTNRNKALKRMLPCLNSDIDDDDINIQNVVRKYCKLTKKISKLPEDATTILDSEVLVKPVEEWKVICQWFKLDELNGGNIIELDENQVITVGMFHELGRYRLKTGKITWATIGKWLAKKFQMDENPSEQYLSFDYKRIHTKFLALVRDKTARDMLLSSAYPCPVPTPNERNKENEIPSNKDNSKKCATDLYKDYKELMELNVQLTSLVGKIEENSTRSQKEQQQKINVLQAELNRMKVQYGKLSEKLEQKSEKLSHYFPRNVSKREKRKDNAILALREKNNILEETNRSLTHHIGQLELNLAESNRKYENERKKLYYYKGKADKASTSKKEELKDLRATVSSLETEKEQLKEAVENQLKESFVQTFKDGKYTKEIRMVYYELLSMNLSVRNCEKVIRTVLGKLSNTEVDSLPTKSVASRLMVESRILAQMQVADAMMEGQHNVLHMDGTKYNFEEKGSFQVVTPSGSYTLSVEDMLSGEAECYLDTFRNVLYEMASLLVEPEGVEEKVAHLVVSIKNLMTDRVVTNKSFCEQLKQWRDSVLPIAIENYANLPESEKLKLANINHVFCGLHVIHNLGIYAESAMKEWVNLAAKIDVHGGFNTNNSRVYDLLYEISKLCSYRHGDQRNGKAVEWKAFLEKQGLDNYIVSFLHHRFNIYFVLGGAAYYHRQHLKEFLTMIDSNNFLHTSIAADIGNPIYIAGFRALGIFNKLISGPLWRKIEEEEHIFALNPTWLDLKINLQRFGENAEPLLDGECFLGEAAVTTDKIHEELFKDMNNVELDVLTQECLELMCCTCSIVVNNQLADQLPGGKYYHPSEEIQQETELCKTTNILSERDFAQMDRKFHQKPNITTIAASGVIMYLNNKTGTWIDGKLEAEQEKAIAIAMKETPKRIMLYKEKRRGILQSRMDAQDRKKITKQVKEQQKDAQKEELCSEIEKIGGLWTTEDQLVNALKDKPKKKQVNALKTQLAFRKRVLEQTVPDKLLLQTGTSVDGKRREFTVSELQANLTNIIKFCAQTPEARAEEVMEVIVRPNEERREMLNKAKKVLKEKVNNDTDASCHSSLEPMAKKPKRKVPKLFGKRIKHKWEVDGKEIWYDGTVVAVYDEDEYDIDCDFGVKYDDFEDVFEVKLLEDYKKDWVVVVRAANKEEIEGKK